MTFKKFITFSLVMVCGLITVLGQKKGAGVKTKKPPPASKSQPTPTPTTVSEQNSNLPAPIPISGSQGGNQSLRDNRKTLAIIAFENRANKWWKGDWDGGASLASILSYLLATENTYKLINYTQTEQLKDLQDKSKSGRFSRETALAAGKLKSANVAAVGEIINYDVTQKSAGSQFGNKKATFGVVTVIVTLYDITTGELIGSAKADGISKPQVDQTDSTGIVSKTGKGIGGFLGGILKPNAPTAEKETSVNPEQTFMIEASQDALKKIVQQLLQFNQTGQFGDKGTGLLNRKVEGKVANYNKKSKVATLNLTSFDGIKIGDVLKVIKLGKCITNPDTGDIIKCEETEVAQIKVTVVTSNYSEAELISGSEVKDKYIVRQN